MAPVGDTEGLPVTEVDKEAVVEMDADFVKEIVGVGAGVTVREILRVGGCEVEADLVFPVTEADLVREVLGDAEGLGVTDLVRVSDGERLLV